MQIAKSSEIAEKEWQKQAVVSEISPPLGEKNTPQSASTYPYHGDIHQAYAEHNGGTRGSAAAPTSSEPRVKSKSSFSEESILSTTGGGHGRLAGSPARGSLPVVVPRLVRSVGL